MNFNKQRKIITCFFIFTILTFTMSGFVNAQSYTKWYNQAQERIDTLRKGDFGMQIIDENGQPYVGNVSVSLKKHEFPFGIAFDFYEGQGSMGNSFSNENLIQADSDAEIYKSERWSDYLAYAIPVESGKEYKVTLKMAEIFFDAANSRVFDVNVENVPFLNDFDVFAEAGGKNMAIDTSITLTSIDGKISIEFFAVKDNVSIKGIVVEASDGSSIVRINCGGPEITTTAGNHYITEAGFFNPKAKTVASNEQWMQAAMYKYFNYGVSGNSFKWSGIQPRHTTPDYTNFENAVSWTQKVGWDLRAHTLLWGGNDAHAMPDWVRELPTPKAITDTCKMRVQREVLRYKGIIKEYDVINEPLTGHADWLRKTVGDSILWNCFKWAHEVDPDAELYINDYNVEYNWGQAVEYRDLIIKIREMGAPVTGVGLQAHFWDCCRPNINELVKNLNIVAEAGLPMRLTEYDWGSDLTEKQQVDDFVMVATIAFSHPSVNGMISWGLSDKGAWRENSGFFDSNYRPKLAADTLLYLTKTKWATNFDSVYNSSNPMGFNAYYGHYEVEVMVDGLIKVLTVPCLKENADSVFVLNLSDAKLKGPQFVDAMLSDEKEVTISFDKALDEATLEKSDFRVFSSKEIGLDNVQIDPSNNKQLIFTLSKKVKEGVYVSVSYFPGKLKAMDGSFAKAFGPETVSGIPEPNKPEEPEVPNSINMFSVPSAKIFPNPAINMISIENNEFPFKVEMYNSLGMRVYNEYVDSDCFNIDVSQMKRGIFLVKITNAESQIKCQKVILE